MKVKNLVRGVLLLASGAMIHFKRPPSRDKLCVHVYTANAVFTGMEISFFWHIFARRNFVFCCKNKNNKCTFSGETIKINNINESGQNVIVIEIVLETVSIRIFSWLINETSGNNNITIIRKCIVVCYKPNRVTNSAFFFF